MVTHREGKEDAPNLRVEDGTKNTARCTRDRVTRAEITKRTITKDIVAVAHSFKWKCGGGWGHMVRIDQRGWAEARSMRDVRIGKRKNGRQKT